MKIINQKTLFKSMGFCWVIILSIGLSSCEEFLEVKPDQSLVVPTTLEDVRALLDNTNVFNVQSALPMISSEELWISDPGFNALSDPIEQATYTWQEDPFLGGFGGDWVNHYQQVFYANVALEVLNKYKGDQNEMYKTLLGSAYFLRGYAYSQLVFQFAKPFQKNGGNENIPGIVLKETADINEPLRRSSLKKCYDRIIEDLTLAEQLLPERNTPKTRPNKAAALGALSRIYLASFEYAKAADAAIKALSSYPDRLDFNKINVNAARPFSRFDNETVFYSVLASLSFQRSAEVFVEGQLIALYEKDDLRLPAFFDPAPNSRFNYMGKISGDTRNFGGISVGELYLNAMEGLAKAGQNAQALAFLNEFLSLRYSNKTFKPVSGLSSEALLARILEERRKELIGRGIRWMDLRRLNQEGNPVTLKRSVLGQTYELLPNSLRYTYPIPQDEITRSGIEQNPR